jgi:hypothetical protein
MSIRCLITSVTLRTYGPRYLSTGASAAPRAVTALTETTSQYFIANQMCLQMNLIVLLSVPPMMDVSLTLALRSLYVK